MSFWPELQSDEFDFLSLKLSMLWSVPISFPESTCVLVSAKTRSCGARSIRPKFQEIPVQNRMEQTFSGNSFWKFRFTSRGCPFFWKFGNSGNFLFHLAFLPGMNRPQFLWLWKATRWRRVFRVDTTLDAKWSAIVRACSWSLHENVRIWFPGKLRTARSEFPVGQFARFAYYPARKVRKFNSLTNIKEELNSGCMFKLLYMKHLMALKKATSSQSFSILSSNSGWEMCSSGKRMRSVRPGGKYRSIRHTKISEIQTGIFGRMEHAPGIIHFKSPRFWDFRFYGACVP